MKIKVDTRGMERAIAQMGKQASRSIEIATQRVLITLARKVKTAEVSEMKRVFDRPTPYALNGFKTYMSKKLTAVVELKDEGRGYHFFTPQIKGGPRRSKSFERALQAIGILPAGWFAVPGQRAKIDAYGNQSRGEIRQILSWFDAAEMVSGSTQNMGQKGRKRRSRGTKKRAGWAYFAVSPNGYNTVFLRSTSRSGRSGLKPGIYRRTNHALGSQIEPVVMFVQDSQYKSRFDFYGVAQKTIDWEFKPALDAAIQTELNKLRR